MWKNHINYFMPPLFGGFSFLLYIVIYFPAPGSEDFVTALLVFCAGQAWSAVIILSNEKKREILYLYLLLSILIAFLLPLFFKTFNDLWHMASIGLIVLAIISLQLFVPGYLKYRKER